MDRIVLDRIYQDERILEYLRYHPEWYKILYYDPTKIEEFIKEAKTALKIRTYDKIENVKGQLDFIKSIIEYINK